MKYHALTVVLICLVFVSIESFSQSKSNRKPNIKAGNSDSNQWWVGVRGGINLSSSSSQQSYSVFSYTQNATTGFDTKEYHSFNLPGLQFGFSVSYEFMQGLSANILPSYASYRFSYENSFRWYDTENSTKSVTTGYNIVTRLQYIDLPLTFKYEFTRSAFKPYIHVGAFYAFLTDAIKKVETTGIDIASGSDSEINVTELSVGIEDRTKKANYGLIGGLGFTYNVGNARLGLEANYRYGMQNLDNGEFKYTDSQLITGAYDVPDDYSLNSIEISMQVIIPLKFITSKDYVPL